MSAKAASKTKTADKTKEKLSKVKTALAEKYERLMNITPSTPRKKTYRLRAARYRRQAEQLLRP